MKKQGKLILTLSIIAALILAAGAYILLFHTNVSIEQRLSRGDAAIASGNYNRAVRHFEAALEMAGTDPQISINLANAYKLSGNYTKAEYTLVRAITADPSRTALYVALSRIYVEQEKFLDADQLLTNASNEAVKAELESKRPAAPILTPASGYHSDYISVTASCAAGRIFITTDGQYPSNENDLYTSPIPLSAGVTTVHALCVDDSGLVSPILMETYTITGVVEAITLKDSGLDAIVRKALKKNADDLLMSSDLWTIENLTLDSSVKDLSQLTNFIGLTSLKLKDITSPDLGVLTLLPALKELDVSGLVLSSASMKALGALQNLESLKVSTCAITDITALSNLSHLKTLDLSGNVVKDISPLGHLSALENLDLSNNPITNHQTLQYCANLKKLNLTNTQLDRVDFLSGLANLQVLDISDNKVDSIAALEKCSNLKELYASYNKLTAIDVLPKLPKLTDFDGSHNKITKIPTFSKSAALVNLTMSYNSVNAVDGLKDLSNLNYVTLDYNKVKDLSPLQNCKNLVQVDVWNNPVTSASVKALTQHSIIVNYNPNYK